MHRQGPVVCRLKLETPVPLAIGETEGGSNGTVRLEAASNGTVRLGSPGAAGRQLNQRCQVEIVRALSSLITITSII